MPFVPLPFVVAIILAMWIARMLLSDDEASPSWAFLGLLVGCAVQSVLIGLRWGYGLTTLAILLPVAAAAIPPLAFAGFDSIAGRRSRLPGIIGLALPPGVILSLVVAWPDAVDPALVALYAGYGARMLQLARRGPDGLALARLGAAETAHRALTAGGAMLIASALVDLAVLGDLAWRDGRLVPAVVGWVNPMTLLCLGYVALSAEQSRADDVTPAGGEPVATETDPDAEAVVDMLDRLIADRHLYRDVDLSLTRLARRAGLPSRRISSAVNRVRGKNVSQYVNGFRVEAACRLLDDTNRPVTSVMLEVGFQTKSNFNREFRRITGLSPMDWRSRRNPVVGAASKD